MSILRINGGRRLYGEVKVQGAKNSVLPILAASLLTRGDSVIHNCPSLSDVDAAVRILRHLGCGVSVGGGDIAVDSSGITGDAIPKSLMREMRSSVFFLGAMLSRTGRAVLSLPGGCELGPRPVDIHLSALKSLGAEVYEENGIIECKAAHLTGTRIELPFPSVGATENTMLASVSAEGETVIENAAREPEIADLADFLRAAGAEISGAGTGVIKIKGGLRGHGAEHTVIPDRIAAATYLSAAAAAGGSVELTGADASALCAVTGVLSETGCRISAGSDTVFISAPEKLRAARPITTAPYPGFPTDAQPPVMAACLRAEGTTVFAENIFESRYAHVGELVKMGADIKAAGRVAVVTGTERLVGASVEAKDLRGGAALVAAALSCEGTSEISGLCHIDRGYDGIENVLKELGADIARV